MDNRQVTISLHGPTGFINGDVLDAIVIFGTHCIY